MSEFLDKVTDQLNLRWAWEKVRHQAQPGEIWFDEIELASFDLKLEFNLQSIAKEIKRGAYKMTPLKPLPFPKQPDKKGNKRIRQTFQVSVRDQVAWMAMVNVVGSYVDEKIPVWSYGNRLFRSIWIEEDAAGLKWRKVGRYRHASGQLYLPFRQSWPVFRRHVYLTTRAMANSHEDLPKLNERDEEELNLQEKLPEKHRCLFINPDYWNHRKPEGKTQELFWCCIDLEKFYPSLKLGIIKKNIVDQLPSGWKLAADRLMESMLQFKLDLTGWDEEELSLIDLNKRRKTFSHIPTGLYVAGFLANAALLKVDQIVETHLKSHNIAHFRFVDDHIILAYTFEELQQWISLYIKVMNSEKTGTRINLDKVEPKALAEMLIRQKRRPTIKETISAEAKKSCKLDPQFPSPLMTKTIALVSGIARTDFNLLDANELATLTDQLEHLLLVDLPEEEIPEKTRLSFAAMRLTQIVERKLSNDAELISLHYRKEEIDEQLRKLKEKKTTDADLERELKDIEYKIDREKNRLENEANGAFQLLRKALREQPDRVRLWSRAVVMCRLTGVKGLKDLKNDISRIEDGNSLSAQYLMANMLVLLGEQALIASRTLRDQNAAQWRKDAAKKFLCNLWESLLPEPTGVKDHGILAYSWHIYNFGLYCGSLMIKELDKRPSFEKDREQRALSCLTERTIRHAPAAWAWWAVRKTLWDLSPKADSLIHEIGHKLPLLKETLLFWSFFPLDLTPEMISIIANSDLKLSEGWWYDVLRAQKEQGHDSDKFLEINKNTVKKAKQNLMIDQKKSLSLYDWCYFLQKNSKVNDSDPRSGEWTALEIVRQVAEVMATEPSLVTYLTNEQSNRDASPSLHPANIRIPRDWCESESPTWEGWQNKVKEKRIKLVLKEYQIKDLRYTPAVEGSFLFFEINPARGLGLLLYGLLNCSFDLPTLWNGPGHSDVLVMLPRLLLSKMTCSSWTLGVLQGCLLPRSTENLFLKRSNKGTDSDDDMLRDPISFISARQVANALVVCQNKLKDYQLSTFGYGARQLTPVSILQLTHPDWSKVFPSSGNGG